MGIVKVAKQDVPIQADYIGMIPLSRISPQGEGQGVKPRFSKATCIVICVVDSRDEATSSTPKMKCGDPSGRDSVKQRSHERRSVIARPARLSDSHGSE